MVQVTVGGDARKRVLIAGGGVAGLEGMLALAALAGDLVEIELLTPSEVFLYRPLQVTEPFGVADPVRLELARIVSEVGARHTADALAAVDPVRRRVTTAGGAVIEFDALLVAPGARQVEAVPGALTFGEDDERRRFADLLAILGQRTMRRLAFVVPRRVSWSIAAYELALLTAAERDARRLRGVEIVLVTSESAPLGVFGSPTSQLLSARLEEAGVSLLASSVADRVADRRLLLANGHSLEADCVVALPALEVPAIDGLPQRSGGFVQTDVRMRVVGLEAVWAAGDVTWFPVKQGGLAAQQSDVAARSIAVAAGAHVPIEAFHPVLRAALITGDAPAFLRAPLPGRLGEEAATGHALWRPGTKVAARYLGAYLDRRQAGGPRAELVDLDPAGDSGAALAEHRLAIELLLAAADTDAAAGELEGALRWLEVVEGLNLAIPAAYVARRDAWRRRLKPGAAPQAAAGRIDPSQVSASAAVSDLQRRIGWLRELEGSTGREMDEHLARLDRGIQQLIALSKRAGTLEDAPRRVP
jgi:sulfide:quinone oxidoreductase